MGFLLEARAAFLLTLVGTAVPCLRRGAPFGRVDDTGSLGVESAQFVEKEHFRHGVASGSMNDTGGVLLVHISGSVVDALHRYRLHTRKRQRELHVQRAPVEMRCRPMPRPTRVDVLRSPRPASLGGPSASRRLAVSCPRNTPATGAHDERQLEHPARRRLAHPAR
jgi:hypothetical protein